MRTSKLYIAIGLIVAFGLFTEIAAHADDINQETTIAFSAPVQIPGQVLPAGTYRFQLALPYDDQYLVQIRNADGKVLATLHTVPTALPNADSDTIVTLSPAEFGRPAFLVRWFYPGESTGHEFIYPQQQAQEIAHATQQEYPASQSWNAGYAGSN